MKNSNALLSMLVLFNKFYCNGSNGSNSYCKWDCIMVSWLTAKTGHKYCGMQYVQLQSHLFCVNPAVRWWVKSNNKTTNLRMLSPNVYVLSLSFREMVPSFLSGRSVENGHNLLNFGEQGSQTRQAIYVVITIEKQSKDTRSLWMMSLLKQHHQYPSNDVSFVLTF